MLASACVAVLLVTSLSDVIGKATRNSDSEPSDATKRAFNTNSGRSDSNSVKSFLPWIQKKRSNENLKNVKNVKKRL